MENLLKISKQTSWQIAGKAVTAITTFIILGIVARDYGEAGTGTFTLALTYLGIFYLLADFGFNAHLLSSFHSEEKLTQTVNFRKLLAIRIFWSAILIFIATVTLPFWPFASVEFATAVKFGVLAILASSVFVTANLVFQSKLRYDLSIIASSLGTMLTLGLVYVFSTNHFPLPYTVLAHFLGWLVIGLVSLVLVRRFVTSIVPLVDVNFFLKLFKDSWPIAATMALNVIYFRVDAFMLQVFKSSADVGIYNIAFQVFQTALVLPTFIMNSFYPVMLESLKTDSKKFFAQIKVAFATLLGISVAGTVFTYLLAPFITNLLTGGGFVGSANSLQILSLGFPAYFLSSLLMWIMIAKKHYKLMLLVYAVGLGFNFIANYIYIPQYSFIAASWVTVLSEYLILALQLLALRLVK